MSRRDVTQDEVLTAIVTHLRRTLRLNDRTCYQVLDPMAPPQLGPGGDFIVTVAEGDSSFVFDEQVKGTDTTPGQVCEQLGVYITGYTYIRLDGPEHDGRLLQDPTRGLRQIKRRLLRALVGEDLLTEGDDHFLRNPLYALHCDKFGYDQKKQTGWVSLTFGVDFDWDLTADPEDE